MDGAFRYVVSSGGIDTEKNYPYMARVRPAIIHYNECLNNRSIVLLIFMNNHSYSILFKIIRKRTIKKKQRYTIKEKMTKHVHIHTQTNTSKYDMTISIELQFTALMVNFMSVFIIVFCFIYYY